MNLLMGLTCVGVLHSSVQCCNFYQGCLESLPLSVARTQFSKTKDNARTVTLLLKY